MSPHEREAGPAVISADDINAFLLGCINHPIFDFYILSDESDVFFGSCEDVIGYIGSHGYPSGLNITELGEGIPGV